MRGTLPTLDELRARRRDATRALNVRVVPALLVACIVELALFAAIFRERASLMARGLLLPLVVAVATMMSAVIAWTLMRWRPRLAAEEAARHALFCPGCGAQVLYTPLSAPFGARSGGRASGSPGIEDRCTGCGAALISGPSIA